MLKEDLQPEESLEEEQIFREQIGEIVLSQNNVKRKIGGRLLWDSIKRAQAVYNNDTIRTGLNSLAIIKLKDESVLEVEENSLIVLEQGGSSLNVDFRTGEFKTKSKSEKLKIRIKDSVINAKNSELKIKTDTKKNTQIQLTKGKAELQSKEGKIQLNKNKQLQINAQGKAQQLAIHLLLSSPQNKAEIIDPNPRLTYPFTWAVLNKNIKKEIFQISKDPDFPSTSTYSKSAHQAIEAPINRGTNYWRVGWDLIDPKTKKPVRQYTPVRSISLKQDLRVQLLQPDNQSQFEFTPGEELINFHWRSKTPAKVFLFELANSSHFRQILKTKTIASSSFQINELKQGTYYWRISAFGEQNKNIGKSATYNFTVTKVMPRAPNLIAPENGAIWSLNEPIRMEWQSYKKAKSYQLKISKDPSLKSVVKQQTLKDLKYIWEWSQVGNYYWQISALNKDSTRIAQSLIYRISIDPTVLGPMITLIKPKNQSEVKRERRAPMDPIIFEWKPEKPMKANYDFIFSEDISFKKAKVKRNIDVLKYALRLKKAGNYFWQIRWVDPKNPKNTEKSKIQVFKYRISSSLPPPKLQIPINLEKKVVPKAQPIIFQWAKVKLAKKYRFILEKWNSRTKEKLPVEDKYVKSNKTKSKPLEKGTYFWTVRPVDADATEGSAAEPNKFDVDLNPSLAAPKLAPAIVK